MQYALEFAIKFDAERDEKARLIADSILATTDAQMKLFSLLGLDNPLIDEVVLADDSHFASFGENRFIDLTADIPRNEDGENDKIEERGKQRASQEEDEQD